MKVFSAKKYVEHFESFLGAGWVDIPTWVKVMDGKEVIDTKLAGRKRAGRTYCFRSIVKDRKQHSVIVHENWVETI